jgi:hypothetical protein
MKAHPYTIIGMASNNPLKWAQAQHLLGTFLFHKEGLLEIPLQIETIKIAINAFRSTLEIYTKEKNENEWARSQYDLGMAITSLFEMSQENINPELVVSALTALQSALEVYNSDQYPNKWVLANIGIAYIYYISAWFIEDKDMQIVQLRKAYHVIESVLTSHILITTQESQSLPVTLFQQIKEVLAKLENIS